MKTTIQRAAIALIAAATLYPAAGAFAQDDGRTQGRAVITVLGKNAETAAPTVTEQDIKVQVNGKNSSVTGWVPLKGEHDGLEMVVLIDDSARTSLGRQLDEIGHFIQTLPPDSKAAVAYMTNGRAVFGGPFSTDRAQTLKQIHIPIGVPGENASPYFCLSDLAKSWPSTDRNVRREVVMITDGVDNYERRFDPDDPYVQAAAADSVRAGLIVYSIYWQDSGRAQRGFYATNSGQNLLSLITQATGGTDYWQGTGNPVSFLPFFDDLNRRLQNQYELGFTAQPPRKPEVQNLKLKISAPGIKVSAPQQVFIAPGGVAQR
jgi:hypothetical protein